MTFKCTHYTVLFFFFFKEFSSRQHVFVIYQENGSAKLHLKCPVLVTQIHPHFFNKTDGAIGKLCRCVRLSFLQEIDGGTAVGTYYLYFIMNKRAKELQFS